MHPDNHRPHPYRCKILATLLLSLLLLSACSAPTALPQGEQPTAPVELPTAAPEATPTNPPAESKVVLVGAPSPELEALARELAEENGDGLELRPTLAAGEVQEGWRVVVLSAPVDNLAGIAGSAPQTQFVVISPVDVEPAANLSVIRARPEYEAFAAGYISVLITGDWRAAGLFPSDTALGATLEDAFRNGGGYYCGRCVPLLTPYVRFPVPVSLPSASPLADWQNVAGTLSETVVYTIYVSPQVGTPELAYDLASRGFLLFGGQTPGDEVRPRWALTLRTDVLSPLRELWPALLAGEGGKTAAASLSMTDIDTQVFTAGKQMLAEEMIEDLTAGYINPFNP